MLGIQHPNYPCMQQTATSSLPRAHLTADRSRTCICCYSYRSVRCPIPSLPRFHPRARGVGGSAPAPRGDSAGRAPSPRRCSAPRPGPAHVTTPEKWVKGRAAAAPRRPTTARPAAGAAPPRAAGTPDLSRLFCAGREGAANAKQKFPKRRTASNERRKVHLKARRKKAVYLVCAT